MRGTLRERFLDKISPEPNSGCWLWTASLDTKGYGKIGGGPRGSGYLQAHRVAYSLFRGEIPAGLELDHTCRVRCCVNPDHLEPVTHRENCVRGLAPQLLSAFWRAKTHCVKGHLFDIIVRSGRDDECRGCSICRKESRKKYRNTPEFRAARNTKLRAKRAASK